MRDLALKHNVIAGISDEGFVYCLTSSDNRMALTKRLEQLGLMVPPNALVCVLTETGSWRRQRRRRA